MSEAYMLSNKNSSWEVTSVSSMEFLDSTVGAKSINRFKKREYFSGEISLASGMTESFLQAFAKKS
jgi:hypothetical protein